jgi:hypothetical protein
MSIRAWVVACACWLPLTANAAKPQATYEMEAKGEIEIGADGSVHDYRLKSKLNPAIAAIVDRNVRGWKFEPIVVDGKPVIGKTMMRLALSASPAGGDDEYRLKVENVWFGEPERPHAMKPPKYPMNAVYARLGAKVILVLRLDADGNVVDILPEQTSLTASGREGVAEKWRREFEKASMAAAKQWKFDTTERVNGQPVGLSVRVPITYTLTDGHKSDVDGKWQAFVPGPLRPIPWVTPGTVAAQSDRDMLKDGDARPLNSRFKLKDHVIGTTL